MQDIIRIRKVVRCAKLLELDLNDSDVQACMAATLMCQNTNDLSLGSVLSLAFISQSEVFIRALESTSEFVEIKRSLFEQIS